MAALYTAPAKRGFVHVLATMWNLGYLQEFSVMGYTLLLSLIEYKTLVMRGDYDAANEILPNIPQVCNCTRSSLTS